MIPQASSLSSLASHSTALSKQVHHPEQRHCTSVCIRDALPLCWKFSSYMDLPCCSAHQWAICFQPLSILGFCPAFCRLVRPAAMLSSCVVASCFVWAAAGPSCGPPLVFAFLGALELAAAVPPTHRVTGGCAQAATAAAVGGFCEWGACGPPKTMMQGAMGCSGGLGVLRPPQPLGKFYKHIRQGVLLLGVAPLGDAPPV